MMHSEDFRWVLPGSPALDAPPALLEPPRQPLASLIAALDAARVGERNDRAVAAALADFVADPDLLAGIPVPSLSPRYARHLLHAGPGYSLMALVWRPGQMSSVHEHKTWCAFGVHRGSLTESLFRLGKGGLRLMACHQHHPGAVSQSPAGSQAIHRIANLGVETAVSIHVYGVSFDRIGEDLSRVWAD